MKRRRTVADHDASVIEAAPRSSAAALGLPPTVLAGDIAALSQRRDEWARWLAAVTWARLDDVVGQTGRDLAQDPSHIVRTGLASTLRDTPAHQPLRPLLGDGVRRTVRDAAQAPRIRRRQRIRDLAEGVLAPLGNPLSAERARTQHRRPAVMLRV